MKYQNYLRTFIFSLAMSFVFYANAETELCNNERVPRGWAVIKNYYDQNCGWDPTFKDNISTIINISTQTKSIVVCYNTPEYSLQGLKLISTHYSDACGFFNLKDNTWVFTKAAPAPAPAPAPIKVSSLLKVYNAITSDMTLDKINQLAGFDGTEYMTRRYHWSIRTGTSDFEIMRISLKKDGVLLYDKDFVNMKTGTLRQTLNSLN